MRRGEILCFHEESPDEPHVYRLPLTHHTSSLTPRNEREEERIPAQPGDHRRHTPQPASDTRQRPVGSRHHAAPSGLYEHSNRT